MSRENHEIWLKLMNAGRYKDAIKFQFDCLLPDVIFWGIACTIAWGIYRLALLIAGVNAQ